MKILLKMLVAFLFVGSVSAESVEGPQCVERETALLKTRNDAQVLILGEEDGDDELCRAVDGCTSYIGPPQSMRPCYIFYIFDSGRDCAFSEPGDDCMVYEYICFGQGTMQDWWCSCCLFDYSCGTQFCKHSYQ